MARSALMFCPAENRLNEKQHAAYQQGITEHAGKGGRCRGFQQNLLLLRRHILHQFEQTGAVGHSVALAQNSQLIRVRRKGVARIIETKAQSSAISRMVTS